MNQLKSKWVLIPFLVSSFLVLFFFQNCSRVTTSSAAGSLAYSSGVQKILLAPDSVADENFCFSGQIKCYLNVYSPDVTDSSQNEKKCILLEGREVCFSLDIHNYDTRSALASCTDCDSSAGIPNGRYRREEATCWLQVGRSENSPFFAVRNNLKDALAENFNTCRASLLSKEIQ